jgi:hypothetical protein
VISFAADQYHHRIFTSVDAQNLEKAVEANVYVHLLFQDGDHDIDADRNPDLGFHGVVAGAVEVLNPQMLFDPFEEQFNLPTTFI